MTFDEFKNNVDLYSADLSRWPQALVKPAVALMKDDASAAALFERQLLTDAQLRAFIPPTPSTAALEGRIMQGLTAQEPASPVAALVAAQKTKGSPWKPAWLFAPSGGLLVAALIGFFIGLNPPPTSYIPLDPSYIVEEQQLASADADSYSEVF